MSPCLVLGTSATTKTNCLRFNIFSKAALANHVNMSISMEHVKERVPCTPVLQDSHLTSYICSLSWIIPVHIEILPFRNEIYSHSNDGESTEKRLLLIKRIFSHLSINVTRGRCIHIYWRPSVSPYLAHPRPRLLTSSWCWQTTSGSMTCPGTTRYIIFTLCPWIKPGFSL